MTIDVETSAAKPKTVTHKGTTIQRRTIAEEIEADKYAAEKTAADNRTNSIKSMIHRFKPPGGVG